jgi:hypothetical protein
MKMPMLVAMLTMVLAATVPALAQDGEFHVTPAEEPAATYVWGPAEFSLGQNPYAPNAGDPSDHVLGELFLRTDPSALKCVQQDSDLRPTDS